METRPTTRRWFLAATALLAMAIGPGCAVRCLRAPRQVGPAAEPNLAVFARPDGSGMVVAYDVRKAGGSALGRRCHAVGAEAADHGATPVFLPLSATNGLVPVPVVPLHAFDDRVHTGLVAVSLDEGRAIEVWSDGRKQATHALPFVSERPWAALRDALVPAGHVVDGVTYLVGEAVGVAVAAGMHQ